MSYNTDFDGILLNLENISKNLKYPARIMVIGSLVGIFHGQPGRMTEDVDVWRPGSDFDLGDFRHACELADVPFDPKEYNAPKHLYIQMIDPGIVHVGKYDNPDKMFRIGKLTVIRPPIENVIASKMVRASNQDMEDVVYLMHHFNLSVDDVTVAVETLKDVCGGKLYDVAKDNMSLLYVMMTPNTILDDIPEIQ